MRLILGSLFLIFLAVACKAALDADRDNRLDKMRGVGL